MSKQLSIEEKTGLFLFAMSWAGYFLFLNILAHIQGGIVEKEEFQIYAHGWLTVPVLTIGAVLFMEKIRAKQFSGNQFFYPILVIGNALFWLAAIWGIRLASLNIEGCTTFACKLAVFDKQMPSFETGEFVRGNLPVALLAGIVIAFPILNIFILAVSRFIKSNNNAASRIYYLIPFIVGAALITYSGFRFEKWGVLVGVGFLALVSFFHKKIAEFRLTQNWQRVADALVLLAIIFLIFDPGLSIDHHHQSHYLGPVCDLMAGKSLLVDIDCQYGILPIYFLAGVFNVIPFSYAGMSFLAMILLALQYFLVYLFLRYILKSPIISIFVLLIIIMANYFAGLGHVTAYPSTGPLRFGLPYLLLFLSVLTARFPRFNKYLWLMEGFVVAMAAVWSFETFTCVLLTFGMIVFFEFLAFRALLKTAVKTVFKRVGWALVFSVLAYLLLIADIYRRSGQWPHWNYYFDFIFLYSAKGFGTMLIAPWSPWIFFILIPLASLLTIVYIVVYTNASRWSSELKIIAGLTGFSIAQLTYYVGRSHPNNLFHICIPIIIIAAFAMTKFARFEIASLRRFYTCVIYVAYAAVFLFILNLTPKTLEKFNALKNDYREVQTNLVSLWSRMPTNERVADAIKAIDKYTVKGSRVAIFLSPDDTTETLMLSHRAHIFPFNYILQESILEPASKRVFEFKHPLKPGDYLFISRDYADLEARIVNNLQQQFKFQLKEITPHGVMVMQLAAK